MEKKALDAWKAVAISAVWLSVGVASFHLGFFTIGMAFVAYLATLTIVE